MLIPRATVARTADAPCPIPKAIDRARKPDTLDAYAVRPHRRGRQLHPVLPRTMKTPACSRWLRRGEQPSRQAPHPPSPRLRRDKAERRSGQRADRLQVFNERRAHRSPYSFTCTPTASVRTTQRFKALLSSVAVNGPVVRTHAVPLYPGQFTEPAEPVKQNKYASRQAGSAPVPHAECRRGRRHLDAPAGRSYSGTAKTRKRPC
jgi:hypothetical protein